ncbi:DUF6263 family protein [Mucilaginibacter sp. FT3.2]|uniref:DUF6263 family protein n=1 Tax=Mucilaginibacter sp. FT3.2 TaxID=2723090 RepID=UPI00161DDAE2|nr:DUF6263 family protein [Mucilaginibacter sp. FT3.2]MBB6231432.1 hypothetical protein [Mucilaginibacter sp. FT3.2]
MKHLLCLFLVLFAAIACRAQKLKLVLHLTKGNTYNMVSTSTSAIKQTINGQVNNIDVTISGTTAFKVLNADDSLYYMEVTYKKLDMKMQLPTGAISFNSQKKDTTDIMSSILGALIDKPFTATFTKSGKIHSVENVESMISSVLDGFSQIQGLQKEQLKAKFIQSFGGGAIKGSIEMSTAVFPEVAVAKNDKWTIHTQLQSTMKADVNTVYQLTGVSPACYLIHGDATITTIKDPVPGMPMTYDMKGTMTSDIKADKVTGWITESRIKQNISGTIAIKDNPDAPGGVTFPMSMIGETVITDR